MARIDWLVRGLVQGVGFRPFCARLARDLGLDGWVRNTSEGVRIRCEGPGESLAAYERRLRAEAPPLALIESLERLPGAGKPPTEDFGEDSGDQVLPGRFEIRESASGEEVEVLIPPDIATCEACLAEFRDPRNRRYGYPFINCTDCGPRYSIVRSLPYDRPRTTMACFPLCPDCAAEYADPAHRRYHAQPNACPVCGPRLWRADGSGESLAEGEAALEETLRALERGEIVAVKGIGGFHLVCRADEERAVLRLRERKHRPDKPFALMARDMEALEELVRLTPEARREATDPRRPILLCPRRDAAPVAPSVAPRVRDLGVMLPYAPLQHRILAPFRALVFTSANRSEEPLVSGNREAREALRGIADSYLFHDRDIRSKIDDSVVAPLGRRSVLIRRARGYVPTPVPVRASLPPLFAAGGEVKAAFAAALGRRIIPGPYLGDLQEAATHAFYRDAARHLLDLYRIEPRILAHDTHPRYHSTALGKEMVPDPEATIPVQHHHAHLAACLGENGVEGPALGWILDGTGYGTDGTIWGGELLFGDARACVRVGSLLPAPLSGGERAIREPWRHGVGLLVGAYGEREGAERAARIFPERAERGPEGPGIGDILRGLRASPTTTSCGRLFDAAAAILGLGRRASYEAQAAMELESAARGSGFLPFDVREEGERLILDWRPAIRALAERRERESAAALSAAFHGGLAEALARGAERAARRAGTDRIALSGGVWQNRRLLSLAEAFLRRRGLEPILHRRLAPNDECIGAGQAFVAAACLGEGPSRRRGPEAEGTPRAQSSS